LVGAATSLEGRATGDSSLTWETGLPGAFAAISSRRVRHSGKAAITASPFMA
jgi:hypothetical protein